MTTQQSLWWISSIHTSTPASKSLYNIQFVFFWFITETSAVFFTLQSLKQTQDNKDTLSQNLFLVLTTITNMLPILLSPQNRSPKSKRWKVQTLKTWNQSTTNCYLKVKREKKYIFKANDGNLTVMITRAKHQYYCHLTVNPQWVQYNLSIHISLMTFLLSCSTKMRSRTWKVLIKEWV